MGRFVNKPEWLNDNYDRCAVYVIESVDKAMGESERPTTIFKPDADLDFETISKNQSLLSWEDKRSVKEMHFMTLTSLSDEAIIYFLPSIARMALTVHDFDSHSPAENGEFDQAVLDKCLQTFPIMSSQQRSAAKQLLQCITLKFRAKHDFTPLNKIWDKVADDPNWLALFHLATENE